MANLKDHQQAMVDLLASGSGIPASASRLAHAMHDVLEVLQGTEAGDKLAIGEIVRFECTTPGLNDKALAADIEACRPKDTMFDRARAAERRVKELENTVKQLRASNAKLRGERDMLHGRLLAHEHPTEPEHDAMEGEFYTKSVKPSGTSGGHPVDTPKGGKFPLPEQAVPYKSVPFAPVKECKHKRHQVTETFMECLDCGVDLSYELQHEQAGCRKDDTQVCDHDWQLVTWCSDLQQCQKCGATKK